MAREDKPDEDDTGDQPDRPTEGPGDWWHWDGESDDPDEADDDATDNPAGDAAAPTADDATDSRVDGFLTRADRVLFDTPKRTALTVGVILVILGVILTGLTKPLWESGGSSKAPTVIVNGGSVASAPPSAKSAVDEVASRPIWSSAPATYSEANEAVHSKSYEITLPSPTGLTSGPTVYSPDAVAGFRSNEVEGSILVVGKVGAVQTVLSRFLGEQTVEEEVDETHSAKPTAQLELIGSHTENTYVELDGETPGPSPGEIVVVLGRVAAIGETHGERVKSAYVLAEKSEGIEGGTEIDSKKMREAYFEAIGKHSAAGGGGDGGGGIPSLP
jgi:hypothetical protein